MHRQFSRNVRGCRARSEVQGGRSLRSPRKMFRGSIEALVFDLDGTAVPNGYQGVPRGHLLATLRELQKCMHVCAATGRPWSTGRDLIRALGIIDPCVTGGGSQIVDPVAGKVIWEARLSVEQIEEIFRRCEPYPYEILYDDEFIGGGKPAWERAAARSTSSLYVMNVLPLDEMRLVGLIRGVLGVTCRKGLSWSGVGVDLHVTTVDATKRETLYRLWALTGVNPEATVGFGDGANDIGLFEAVGWRVAVQGAAPELSILADAMCAPPSEDGLSRILHEMFFEPSRTRLRRNSLSPSSSTGDRSR